MPYDSFEWQQDPPPSNGVPRSAWTRSHKRLSRWHRPYTMVLTFLDLVSVLLASYLAATFLEKAKSGFQLRTWGFLHAGELTDQAALDGFQVLAMAPLAPGLQHEVHDAGVGERHVSVEG